MSDDEEMKLPYLKALLKTVTREPGRLVYMLPGGLEEEMTADGLLSKYEAQFPEIRAWYNDYKRRVTN